MSRSALWTLVCALVALSRVSHAQPQGRVDVDALLARTAVKLLAVEFYSTDCKPCMKAVPQWKALHEKYRAQGLRLVVVKVTDPDAPRCAVLPLQWAPDQEVCDYGPVQEQFGVTGLPEAFLWSWQGRTLIRHGLHVDAVEKAVQRYLAGAPRVVVDAFGRNGRKDSTLQRHVEDALSTRGKITVVADKPTRATMRAHRKETSNPTFEDDKRCQLGRALPPNSLLEARVGRTRRKLHLRMFSLERQCLPVSASVVWTSAHPERSAAAAVDALLAKLRERASFGASSITQKRPIQPAETDIGQPAADWSPTPAGPSVVVRFESRPPGAMVVVDGNALCPATPCSKAVGVGSHVVQMSRQGHVVREERVAVRKGTPIVWKLTPDSGTLSITSTPAGLPVLINGKRTGVTPLKRHTLGPGRYEVLVRDRCYYDSGKRGLLVERGKHRSVDLKPLTRPAGLTVKARDAKGNDLVADVLVDGQKLGQTPGTFQVSVCAGQLQIHGRGMKTWSKRLELVEKRTTTFSATLRARRAVCGDNMCSGLENCGNCPGDCPCSGKCRRLRSRYACVGDHHCSRRHGENCKNSPADCRCTGGKVCMPNGRCDSAEVPDF